MQAYTRHCRLASLGVAEPGPNTRNEEALACPMAERLPDLLERTLRGRSASPSRPEQLELCGRKSEPRRLAIMTAMGIWVLPPAGRDMFSRQSGVLFQWCMRHKSGKKFSRYCKMLVLQRLITNTGVQEKCTSYVMKIRPNCALAYGLL